MSVEHLSRLWFLRRSLDRVHARIARSYVVKALSHAKQLLIQNVKSKDAAASTTFQDVIRNTSKRNLSLERPW